jgi:hypothetical protein
MNSPPVSNFVKLKNYFLASSFGASSAGPGYSATD